MRPPSSDRKITAALPDVKHSALGPGKYRADLDGLRAIAVLAVVGYHAFPRIVTGGFVGVDVFFVISGFLISSIVFSRLERGCFSLAEFYDRRIRRIFPALIVMMAAALIFGWFALLAQEYRQLGKHVASGAGFVSNVVLWSESGYFDEAVEAKPMLHLWSLAIEEQFYIFWPLLLALVWKRRWSFLRLTIAIATVSFAGNLCLVGRSASAVFYFPFTRFWELMIGGMLAYRSLRRPESSGKYVNVQAGLGLALLTVSIVCFDRTSPFPGWRALFPTVGTALMVSAGPGAFLNRRLLSDRALVWFGLISYPLYLWHWPLLSFAQIVEGEPPPTDVKLIAVVAAVGLSWLTYAFVERRLRHAARSPSIVLGLLAAMGLLVVAGCLVFQTHGFVARASMQGATVTAGDLGHHEFHAYMQQHFQPCTPAEIHRDAPVWEASPRCFQSTTSPRKTIAILGDSHAEHLFLGIAEALPNANVVEYIKGSLPVIGNEEFRHIFNCVIGDTSIRKVMIAANWSMRTAYGQQFEEALRQTTSALTATGKTVFLVEDVPAFRFEPRRCKSSGRFGQRYRCTQERNDGFPNHEAILDLFARVASVDERVKILRTVDHLCERDHCFMAKDGSLLYRDSHHLGILGSRYLGARLLRDHPELQGCDAEAPCP